MKKTTPKKTAMQKQKEAKKTAPKRKPIKREPTEMQKRLVEKLKEKAGKGGKIVLTEVAEEAGYSMKTKSPGRILKSPAVRRYIKKMDMDGDAAKMGHDWLFNSTQIMRLKYPSEIEQKTIIQSVYAQIPRAKLLVSYEVGSGKNAQIEYHFTIPDKFTVSKAVEMMYKINPPKQVIDIKAVSKIRKKKLEEVAEAMERLKLKNPIKYNTEGFQTIQSESPLTQQENLKK